MVYLTSKFWGIFFFLKKNIGSVFLYLDHPLKEMYIEENRNTKKHKTAVTHGSKHFWWSTFSRCYCERQMKKWTVTTLFLNNHIAFATVYVS